MGRLELRFLGAPEVWYEGQLRQFPTRKALALLVYLAVTGERHSREHLIALFWPESDMQRGQASLRNALLRLRRSLGEADKHLVVEGDFLALDLVEDVALDLQTVAASAGARRVVVLQEAVDLYRGDFLAGFTLPDAPGFDEWAGVQREHWHRQMSELLAQLCQQQADEGDRRGALATAVRWTQHDPLDEAAHRRLMELHLAEGDKTAALQAYQKCRALLADELGIEPSPATQVLATQIRRMGNLRLHGEGRRMKQRADFPPSSFIIHPSSLPFVGRSAKHLQLVTAYHAARQGQTQAVIIEGEAGIGKTRLASEFLKWAATQGADVLSGRAFEAGGRLPYQPLVDALRPRLEQENAPEDLLDDVWLAELSRLLPELRHRYPDLALPSGDENTARTRLLEAVARLGQALLERRQPVIIFIDDLHWADTATLDTLHYCLQAWGTGGWAILVLLTLRSEALAATTALNQWLTNLGRVIAVRRFGLGPLTARDINELVQTFHEEEQRPTSSSQPSALASWLFTETAGHPFYVTEILKALAEQNVLRWQATPEGRWMLDLTGVESWLATPAKTSFMPLGVRQLIQSRLNQLTSTAAALLTAAAVLGRECSYTRLCQVAGVQEAPALSGLDELVNGRLLRETSQPTRPYAIAHDKIREVVYAEAGAARRQLWHRRALAALEADLAPPAELAHHALAAQLPAAAFRHSLAAGDHALDLFAVHDAITYYEQARHQLSITNYQLPITNLQSQISNLYLNLGRAYELVGELKQAETIYEELRHLAEAASQPEMVCLALNRLATVAVHAYTFDTAVAHLQQAVQVAQSSGHKALLAETEWSLAQLYHHRFDFRQSEEHSRRTLALARELDDRPLIAGSLNALGYAQMLLGQVGEGQATMIEARDRYARLGNKALEADCLTAIAAAQMCQGRLRAGIETAHIAEAICAKIENPWGHIYSRVWLATGLLDSGNYEAALAVAQAGQNQAGTHNLPPMSLFISLILGKIHQALGQWTAAYETHQAASALNEQVKSDVHTAFISAELCADCALAGNWAEAATHARQALAYRQYDVLPLVIPARWLETEALLRGGDIELAREDAGRWGEVVGRVPRFRVGHLRSLALLAGWDGDIKQAITHLEEALSLAEDIGLPGEQWPILAKLEELYQAIGDEEQARQAPGKAAEIIQALAARIDDEGLRTGFLAAEPVRRVLAKTNP